MMIRIQVTLLVISLGWLSSPLKAEDFSGELPRVPATPPGEMLKKLEVADGFRVELIACEPLVNSPVAIHWDATGTLYVCEMRGYSERRDECISRIRTLHDDDQDGIYDRAQTYADHLKWPTGLFAYQGGLLVGDAPDLLYFKDVDGDGKAEQRQVLLTGFGHHNVQGLMNSFRWGLDNRIHIASGTVGGNVRRPDQDAGQAVSVRGRDIALDPRTGEFRLTSGGGQHGMDFDDWGRKYVSSNSDHLSQVVLNTEELSAYTTRPFPSPRVSISADGPQAEVFRVSPVEPWRVLRTRLRVAGKVPGPIEGGGRPAGYFTGATGVTIYRGDQWDAAHRGVAIVGDVGSNLVHRKRLLANGVPRIAHRIDEKSELIASRDIWFRPAQFACGPDGGLTIVDVCREVIEHPQSLPPDLKRHLDLTAGTDRGRLIRVLGPAAVRREIPNLRKASSLELVALLRHNNAWHRERASQLLYEREDASVIKPLQKMVRQDNNPLARLHGFSSLLAYQSNDASPPIDHALMITALTDSCPEIRCHALRSLPNWYRRQTESDRGHRFPLPPWLQPTVSALAKDPSIEVRFHVVACLMQMECECSVQLLTSIIKQDVQDRWIRSMVLAATRVDDEQLFVQLASDSDFRSAEASQFLLELARQLKASASAGAIANAMQAVVALMPTDPLFSLPLLGELGGLSTLNREQGKQFRKQLLDLCTQTLNSESVTLNQRMQAIHHLRYVSFEEAQLSLFASLRNPRLLNLQSKVMETLANWEQPQIADRILQDWVQLSPAGRAAAIELLCSKASYVSILLDAIDEGTVAPQMLSRSRVEQLRQWPDTKIRNRAQTLLANWQQDSRSRVIERYRVALQPTGDVQRGRDLFVQHCANCHRYAQLGVEIGPNLAAMKTRGREAILVNVLDPNREVNPQFVNYRVLTTRGQIKTGMLDSETSTGITLRRAEGIRETISRDEIDQLRTSGLSLMPEGFESAITIQQMSDLISFLMDSGSED